MEEHRKYPLSESRFKELIKPFIKVKFKNQGRPTKVSPSSFVDRFIY